MKWWRGWLREDAAVRWWPGALRASYSLPVQRGERGGRVFGAAVDLQLLEALPVKQESGAGTGMAGRGS